VLDGFTRDERLQNSADTRTRGITVAAFLNGPRSTNDADDHIGGGRDAFFGDEEVQLARPGQTEPCKQPVLRDCVLHEVDVSIEVEAKWGGPDLSHSDDGGEVSLLAATDQRHGGAATRRFRNTELRLSHRNDIEAGWLLFVAQV
jgi:hypothetical protein